MKFPFSGLIVLAAMAVPAGAEVKSYMRPVACGTPAEVHALVPKEQVTLRAQLGKDDKSGTVEMWVDPATGSWSFVKIISARMICVYVGGYSRMIEIKPGVPL